MRLRPGARQRRVREQPQAPPFTVERSRWRPFPKEPLRGHVSGAHMGKPSTVSPGAKRRANPAGVSLMDETNNTQTRFWAATLRDGALFAHSGVARRSFGITKRRSSRLGLRENSLRRTCEDY